MRQGYFNRVFFRSFSDEKPGLTQQASWPDPKNIVTSTSSRKGRPEKSRQAQRIDQQHAPLQPLQQFLPLIQRSTQPYHKVQQPAMTPVHQIVSRVGKANKHKQQVQGY
ncbi:hypothetical protein RRG08_008929 [Elysia crispata]|uniref:Uncharacterized protein n=1 Tax=Elysia crispata TaxID=231223 RepID=A0AAE0ZWP5_9GAST|nr:hypothetical protein RRG08_008929 [Elysia crispata]